jgi:methionyl-tRNA formyltransferase
MKLFDFDYKNYIIEKKIYIFANFRICMLRVFTRKREYPLLKEFFDDLNIEYELYKSKDFITLEPFDFGVSYCYSKKIEPPLLYLARKGFVNYHPAPLPQYPNGPNIKGNASDRALEQKVSKWGVTVHYMNEEYDKGEVINKKMYQLMEPAKSLDEHGALAHFHMWKLFQETIIDLYHFSNPINDSFIKKFQNKNEKITRIQL